MTPKPLQPLSSCTKSVLMWVSKWGTSLVFIEVITGMAIAFLYIRRQTLRYEPRVWSSIRSSLVMSTLILAILFADLAGSSLLSIKEPHYLQIMLYALFYLCVGAGIYGIGLHYKKVFALSRIRTFMHGFLIGCVLCVLMLAGSGLLTEYMLNLDPAYTALVNRVAVLKTKEL